MTRRSYKEVMSEIAKLEEEAAEAREHELQAVIADIRAKVSEYGLTEEDVFGRQRKARASRESTVSTVKYRDPKTGNEWSGRGRAPSWIAGAKNRDRFLVEQ